MAFGMKYINIFDDVNTDNVDEISQFYRESDIQIDNGLELPDVATIENVGSGLRLFGEVSDENVKKHLVSSCGFSEEAASVLSNNITSELSLLVPNKNALVSNYIKIACWLKRDFAGAQKGGQNIFFRGQVGKYQLYTLYLLSKLGNNIVIVDENLDKNKYSQYNNTRFNLSGKQERLGIVKLEVLTFDEISTLLNSDKIEVKVGSKTLIVGRDECGKLNNMLYDVYCKTPDSVLLFPDGISKPSYSDMQAIPKYAAQSVDGLIKKISANALFTKNSEYSSRAMKYLGDVLRTYSNTTQAQNTMLEFVYLYNKYDLSKEVIVVYSVLNKLLNIFLSFLASIGKAVIVVDETGKSKEGSLATEWDIIDLGDYTENPQYPKSSIASTLAYSASQEINKKLFSGATLGLYQSMQFKTCNIIELRTTLDELLMYWWQENQIRPHFSTDKNNVTVPVMCSSIVGVNGEYSHIIAKTKGDAISAYGVDEMQHLVANNMVIRHLASVDGVPFEEQKPLIKDGKLLIKEVQSVRNYSYKHLSEAASYHILSKINEIIEGDYIDYSGISQEEFFDTVLNVGLNLSTKIQQKIQAYDYTKEAPKFILYANDEKLLSIRDCILITLLHLCGWDILIFIPTGYNIFGDNFKREFIQQHTVGGLKFDINFKTLDESTPEKKGFFSRLFI